MSESAAERIARNQALFREVNERIEELAESAAAALGGLDDARVQQWVCECYRTECAEHVSLAMSEYESIRSHPSRFFVAPGDDHVDEDYERVVARNDGYWVVEKIGVAGEVAAAYDPR